jgi:hypothetical protein
MPLTPELENILSIIADIAHNDINTSVMDTAVIHRGGLSRVEANNCLDELESYGWSNQNTI